MQAGITENAKMMQNLIDALKKEGHRSQGLVVAKANAMREYDKQMGVFCVKLKDAGLPATLIKDRARAECSEFLYQKVVAEETLKAHYSRLDTLKAQLNGYQSINRYLDSTA
jgi:hypothetical protein